MIKASRSLFSNSLSGLVVPCDTSLTYKGTLGSNLLELNEASTDPIFDSLQDQIDQLKLQTKSIGDPLVPGDFFITRHSKMGEFQAIFHFISEDPRYILFFCFFFVYFVLYSFP